MGDGLMLGETPRYDAIADWYAGFTKGWYTEPLALLPAHLTGQRVLDLGCGQGNIARWLARHGAAVVGVDLSSGMLVIAEQHDAPESAAVQYIRGDASTTEWWDGRSFDGVISHMALMDIDDLDGALATAATVLRPGGWFTFSVFHPCYPGGPEGSASGLPSWPPDLGYAHEGRWCTEGDGIRGRVGAVHRRLSTYLNATLRAGFTLEETAETGDAVPVFLAVRATKP